jgi:hypothetical protein
MYPKAAASIRASVHAFNTWLHGVGATRIVKGARATPLLTVCFIVLFSAGASFAGETPVRSVPGLSSITFVENTGVNTEYTFSPNDTALLTRLPNPLTAEDFHGVQTELYDVFYSNCDGTLNNDGAYVTIEAVFDQQAPSGGGLNISEVRLNKGFQFEYGNVVSSAVYLGNNSIPGSAALTIDGNLATDCSMGNTVGEGNRRLRVTMGFGSSSGEQLTGITFTYSEPPNPSYLYTINKSTGVATNQRSTGVVRMVGLARAPGDPNTAYAINTFNGAHNLYRINIVTGASTLIGDTHIGLTEGDLAFAPDGILYAISFTGGTLYRINTATGAATNPVQIVGSPNSGGGQQSDFSAMDFDAAGNLWILDVSWTPDLLPTYLLKVDRNSGSVLAAVTVSQHLGTTCGMSFDRSTGQLWVGDGTENGSNNIYHLNITNGVLTPVGGAGLPTTDGLSGLSFAPAPVCPVGVPAPALSTMGQIAFAFLFLAAFTWMAARRLTA